MSILGLFIRAMAAGFIHKEKQLTTTGPYAFTRNPLYFGSFFLGLGITIAGGQWLFPGPLPGLLRHGVRPHHRG